jgi:uncharacterized iron-regulated membrane protein
LNGWNIWNDLNFTQVRSMNSQRIYKIHKSLAVSVGAFFLAWLISGIIMILPRLSGERERRPVTGAIDIEKVSVSAQEAVAKVATMLGELPQVREIKLKRVADTDVYEILTARHGSHLIDARSGEPFSITTQGAEAIAKRHMKSVPGELRVALLSRHEFTYPSGPLPVYRVVDAEEPSTIYYVSATDGTVTRSDRESRIRNAIASLHTLEPVNFLIGRQAVRKGLLILISLVGIVAVGTGFYLAWPRQRRQLALFRH